MKKASELLFLRAGYGFEPKSIWPYQRGTDFDVGIKDDIAKDSFKMDMEKNWMKIGRSSLSKFNSENAKNLIEYLTFEGDIILDPFAGRTRAKIAQTFRQNASLYTHRLLLSVEC